MHKINICVCTYQRSQLLKECVGSLAQIAVPDGVVLSVTVIDNDASCSSAPCVEQLQEGFPHALHYVCEEQRGIPFARNRAIDETLSASSDYLVFIDDDERVEKDWLVQLYSYCRSKNGNVVVHGRVIQELPPETPQHMRIFFENNKRVTGDRLSSCATNNVIIPFCVYSDPSLRFDETHALAGGTDTIYFTQAVQKGVEIYECSEAVVRESIPASRASLEWFSKRKFRAGITEAWGKKQRNRSSLSIFLSSLSQIFIEITKLVLVSLVCNKVQRNKSWFKVCRCFGVIFGLLGLQVESYRKIDS